MQIGSDDSNGVCTNKRRKPAHLHPSRFHPATANRAASKPRQVEFISKSWPLRHAGAWMRSRCGRSQISLTRPVRGKINEPPSLLKNPSDRGSEKLSLIGRAAFGEERLPFVRAKRLSNAAADDINNKSMAAAKTDNIFHLSSEPGAFSREFFSLVRSLFGAAGRGIRRAQPLSLEAAFRRSVRDVGLE